MKVRVRSILAAATIPLAASLAYADQCRVVGTGDGMGVLTALGAAYMADNPGSIVDYARLNKASALPQAMGALPVAE